MARIVTCGFDVQIGGTAVQSPEGQKHSYEGGASVSTAVVRSALGGGSMLCNAASEYCRWDGFAAPSSAYLFLVNTTYYIQFWLYISAAPASETSIVSVSGLRLRLTTSRTLRLYNVPGAAYFGTESSALATGTWHRVAMKWRINSASTDPVELQLNGTAVGASASAALGSASVYTLDLGASSGTPGTLYFDDVIINSDSGGGTEFDTWPEASWLALLRPTADYTLGTWQQPKTTGSDTTDIWASIDNPVPAGVAHSDTDANALKYIFSTAFGSAYTASFESYTAKGLGVDYIVRLVQGIARVSASSASAGNGTLQLTSNPSNGSSVSFDMATVTAGTEPTGWHTERTTAELTPTVTMGDAPRMTLGPNYSTYISMCDLMGIYVEFIPTWIAHTATETDTALPLLKVIGRGIETDTAQALGRLKRKLLGQTAEADLAQALRAGHLRLLGMPSDLAGFAATPVLSRTKKKTIGVDVGGLSILGSAKVAWGTGDTQKVLNIANETEVKAVIVFCVGASVTPQVTSVVLTYRNSLSVGVPLYDSRNSAGGPYQATFVGLNTGAVGAVSGGNMTVTVNLSAGYAGAVVAVLMGATRDLAVAQGTQNLDVTTYWGSFGVPTAPTEARDYIGLQAVAANFPPSTTTGTTVQSQDTSGGLDYIHVVRPTTTPTQDGGAATTRVDVGSANGCDIQLAFYDASGAWETDDVGAGIGPLRKKAKLLGQNTEIDSNPALRRSIGQIAEADSNAALTRRKARTLGQTSEVDTNAALGTRKKARTLGQTSEADSNAALTRAKRKALGQTSEADTAQAISRRRSRVLGQNSEADTNAALGRLKRKALGQTSEADTNAALTRAKSKTLGQGSEIDAAGAFGRRIGQTSEIDTAQAVRPSHAQTLGQNTEADLAQAIARLKVEALAQNTEADSAQAVTRKKAKLLGQNTEIDSNAALGTRLKRKAIGQTSEADSAQALTRKKAKLLGQNTEADSNAALGRLKAKLLGQNTEADTAQVTRPSRSVPIGQGSETDLARPIGRAMGQGVEADVAQPVSRSKRKTIGVDVGGLSILGSGKVSWTDAAATATIDIANEAEVKAVIVFCEAETAYTPNVDGIVLGYKNSLSVGVPYHSAGTSSGGPYLWTFMALNTGAKGSQAGGNMRVTLTLAAGAYGAAVAVLLGATRDLAVAVVGGSVDVTTFWGVFGSPADQARDYIALQAVAAVSPPSTVTGTTVQSQAIRAGTNYLHVARPTTSPTVDGGSATTRVDAATGNGADANFMFYDASGAWEVDDVGAGIGPTRKKAKALGQTAEADSAQVVGRRKAKAIGQTAEADLAQALGTRLKTKAIGQSTEVDAALGVGSGLGLDLASETDAAQGLLRAKRKLLGQNTEADAAQALTRKKAKLLGQNTEADSNAALGTRLKRKTLGQNTEADTAQALTRRKAKAIGQNSEADTNAALGTQRKRKDLGQNAEAGSNAVLTRAKSKTLGQNTEADAALSVGSGLGLDPASETDAAQGGGRRKSKAIGTGAESDIGQAIARAKARLVGQASETDAAFAAGRKKQKALGQTAEPDAAQTVARRKTRTFTHASEADAAQALGRRKTKALGIPAEPDAVQPIGRARRIEQASEPDIAQPVDRAKRKGLALGAEADSAPALTHAKSAGIGFSSEASQAQAPGRTKRKSIAIAESTEAAQSLDSAKARLVSQAVESDAAQALQRVRSRGVGQPSEVNTAFDLRSRKERAITRAVEVDAAQKLTAHIVGWVYQATLPARAPLGLLRARANDAIPGHASAVAIPAAPGPTLPARAPQAAPTRAKSATLPARAPLGLLRARAPDAIPARAPRANARRAMPPSIPAQAPRNTIKPRSS